MNAKGDLIARTQTLGLGTPTFGAEAEGPPHDRTFRAQVTVGGEVLGRGEGRSKKDAERAAAEAALLVLNGQDGLEAPDTDDRQAQADPEETAPAGRWPIYAAVLAEALEVALEVADEDADLDDVRREAARLYRDLLADLGHGPEEDAE
ncbi:putative dsRNA-binding protein [Deinococcus petrolearius]|uniref:DsRNA-binding protein n=1 Tax=Deinococcus petrolearius TaxID=1751295 RepID=A0ABW1DNJ4_9DEIO